MLLALRHTGIVVSDLAASLHFYGDLLGFSVVKHMDERGPGLDAILALKDVEVTTVKMAAPGGGQIELLHFRSHPSKAQDKAAAFDIGPTHIAIQVDDLDVVYDRLVAENVEFNAPPQCSADGSVNVTFCRDPDGSLVELVEVIGAQ